MKSLVFVLALLPLPAAAVELPVRAVYCGDALDISADGVNGEDFTCSAQSAATDGTAELICSHADPEWGPDWSISAVIVEDFDAGSLAYTVDGDTVVLERCE